MSIFRFSTKANKAHLIKWRPWSKEAFDEASQQKKPVFLSLAAVWCHWCHVMDETTFSHIPSINYLNENFIPIRVDTDHRPDIQNRYIMDGWPTNAFLTDEGDIITGGTYMPPEEFRRLLEKVNHNWLHNQEELRDKARLRRSQVLEKALKEMPSKPALETVDSTLQEYQHSFDNKFGGFGRALKFPSPLSIELFMREAQVGARRAVPLLNIVTTTLDNMAKGQIYDNVWGGFFRYATERDWSRPHYEKMLGENAGIIMNYLHAFEITKKELYKQVAVKSLDYLNTYLANHPMGGFFGSQDADEEFYELPAAERTPENMPFIDKTIYTDWCCQMISTYLEAFRILRVPKYLDFAIETMRFLQVNCLSNIGCAHYYTEEEGANIFGLLSDQVWMLIALIDLYEHNPQPDYLTQANDIVDILVNRLAMPTGRQAGNNSFFDRAKEEDDIGNLLIRYKPVKENSLLALALWRLSVLTNSKDFADMAKNIISAFSFKQFEGDFISMAPYALALSEILSEEIKKAA